LVFDDSPVPTLSQKSGALAFEEIREEALNRQGSVAPRVSHDQFFAFDVDCFNGYASIDDETYSSAMAKRSFADAGSNSLAISTPSVKKDT
jgi:hypothetical protein